MGAHSLPLLKELTMKRRLNLLDTSILVVAVVSALGFALAKGGYAGVDKIIEGKAKLNIAIYLAGFKTVDPEIFKVGDKSSLTIRNQPVDPPMTITAVKHWPKQSTFLAPDGKKAISFPDPSLPLAQIAHDFLVTLTDEAERTKDGYVVRGNKIKVGNTVEIESFKYRVQGVVVELSESP